MHWWVIFIFKRGESTVLDEKMLELFKEELVELNLEVKNVEEFFEVKAQQLLDLNFVNPSFKKAIAKREAAFPTGLEMGNISIAIPHTDVIHIQKPFVSINRVTDDLVFTQMGTDDVEVSVRDIIILGIKDPKKQVSLLSNLMELFSDENFVTDYQQVTSSKEMIELVKKKWQDKN